MPSTTKKTTKTTTNASTKKPKAPRTPPATKRKTAAPGAPRRVSTRVPNLDQPLDLSNVKLSKGAKSLIGGVAADHMLSSVLGQ